MNTQSKPPSGSDDWRLRILSYVDGELDPIARREVEAKLSDDPDLAELLRDLEQTGSNNRELWGDTPPSPNESAWQQARDGIAERLRLTSTRRINGRVKWATVALAACLILGVLIWGSKPWSGDERLVVERPFDPLAEYEVLPIATPDDVMVSVVRGGIEFASIDHPIGGVLSLPDGDDWVRSKPLTVDVSQPTPADTPILIDK